MDQSPVIIVTGASAGVGAATASILGKSGARLVLVARNNERLQKMSSILEDSGIENLAISMDVVNSDLCKELVSRTLTRFGRIDGLVNNAALATPLAYIENADEKAWKYSIEVNLLAPFYLAKFSLKELKKTKGRIVNVSSGAADMIIESGSSYCASKAALNRFTAVLAAEEPEITAVAVRPGVVDTEMQTFMRKEGPKVMPPQTAAFYRNIKEKGMLEPPEVPARSIAWLALHAPAGMSGEYRNYDDADIMGPAKDLFGDM